MSQPVQTGMAARKPRARRAPGQMREHPAAALKALLAGGLTRPLMNRLRARPLLGLWVKPAWAVGWGWMHSFGRRLGNAPGLKGFQNAVAGPVRHHFARVDDDHAIHQRQQ
jgi:hypothetical protein